MRPFRYCFLTVQHESGWFPRLESPDSGMSRDFLCGAAGTLPAGRSCLRGRLCLRAGTSDRCAPAVLSLPPLRGRPLPFTKPRAATPSEVPAHPAFPGRGTMLQPLGCRDYSGFDLCAASIRKSGPEIKNRCTVCPRFNFFAASIRKSWAEFENRCTDCPCFDLMAASIRKSGLEIKNRCTDCPRFDLLAASIRKSGPEIGNHCSAIVPASRMARLRKTVAATMSRPIPIFVAAK